MTEVFFTSDTHFCHRNIIKHCNRPFSTVDEMDEALVEKWNAVVKHHDHVWHLGDFGIGSLPRLQTIFDRLKGKKKLVLGNHDEKGRKIQGWLEQKDIAYINIDRQPIVLCHYALRVWDKSRHGSLHFYGHSHGNLPGNSQSLDVGVDAFDFRPANLEEIRQKLATLPPLFETKQKERNAFTVYLDAGSLEPEEIGPLRDHLTGMAVAVSPFPPESPNLKEKSVLVSRNQPRLNAWSQACGIAIKHRSEGETLAEYRLYHGLLSKKLSR